MWINVLVGILDTNFDYFFALIIYSDLSVKVWYCWKAGRHNFYALQITTYVVYEGLTYYFICADFFVFTHSHAEKGQLSNADLHGVLFSLVNILAKKAVFFPTPTFQRSCFLPPFFARGFFVFVHNNNFNGLNGRKCEYLGKKTAK